MWSRSAALVTVSLGACLSGCRQDMFDQPRYEPLEESDLFTDGASARQAPKGTVAREGRRSGAAEGWTWPARGDLAADKAFRAGVDAGGTFVREAPVKVSREVLARGRERFGIYCAPCHGRVGDGNGMIVLRGFKRPPTFHDDRLRAQAPGYFVNVIANGFGVMPSYAAQVPPEDRWTIALYVGALQVSQSASLPELPAEDAARIVEAR